jgi:hypothetical protein
MSNLNRSERNEPQPHAPYTGSPSYWNVIQFEALSRATAETDAGGGTLNFSYSGNDVYQSLGPAPSGENAKRRQYQYDSLGRLTSVCEITGGSGSGNCPQTNAQTGYFTQYTYNALDDLTGVSQGGAEPLLHIRRAWPRDL